MSSYVALVLGFVVTASVVVEANRWTDAFPHPHRPAPHHWTHPTVLKEEMVDLPGMPQLPGGARQRAELEDLFSTGYEAGEKHEDLTDAAHDHVFQQRTEDVLRDAEGFLREAHGQEETLSQRRTEEVLADAENEVHRKLKKEEEVAEEHPSRPAAHEVGVLAEAQEYLRKKLAEVELKLPSDYEDTKTIES